MGFTAEDIVREDIRCGRKGHIYLCKQCGSEIFKDKFYAKKCSGYCAKCAGKIFNTKERIILTVRKCIDCDRELDISAFSLTGSGHYRSRCTKCTNLLSGFGISYRGYMKMYQEQNGNCAICGKEETAIYQNNIIRSLAIDHCHTTGKIRGLLCTNCNTALGGFKDNKELLLNACKYLEKYEGKSKEDI